MPDLEAIAKASSVVELTDASVHAFERLGFRASFYISVVTADPRVGRIANFVGFPGEWQRQYKSGLHLEDPLPAIGLSHAMAFRWSDANEHAKLTTPQAQYLKLLTEYSNSDGIAIPCYGARSRCGLIGVGNAINDNVWAPQNVLSVQVAGQLSFLRFCEIVHMDAKPLPDLSARELEVLELLAEGKSNSVIGDILKISKSTVDSYVQRIFEKLNVRDRTTASVRALSLGLINPPDCSEFEKEQMLIQTAAQA